MKNDFQSFSTSIAQILPVLSTVTQEGETISTAPINSLHLHDDNTNYDEPENFLEIEIKSARTYYQDNFFITIDATSSRSDHYEIICRTNIPLFKKKISKVRRRYSDFVYFKKCLLKELALNIANTGSTSSNSSKINIPSVPSKMVLNNRFNEELILLRLAELENWLQIVVGHPLLRSNSKVLKRFIQEESFVG
ncbi:hypothetical protein QEN19_003173 [Hanseniaspora menglaensis]